MLDPVMAAGFQHIDETDQIGIDVGVGILDRIAHPGLGRQIHHPPRSVVGEGFGQHRPIFQAGPRLGKTGINLQAGQPRPLQIHVVVIVQIVETDDFVAALQQAQRQRGADETGAARDQDFHSRPSTAVAGSRYLTSNSTESGLPSARMRSIPISRNCRCATARMMAS